MKIIALSEPALKGRQCILTTIKLMSHISNRNCPRKIGKKTNDICSVIFTLSIKIISFWVQSSAFIQFPIDSVEKTSKGAAQVHSLAGQTKPKPILPKWQFKKQPNHDLCVIGVSALAADSIYDWKIFYVGPTVCCKNYNLKQ